MVTDPTAIPEIVIRRLPLYVRALQWLTQEGVVVISSHDLGALLGMTPAQIRKDLSYFGEFGKQGMGYDVNFLHSQLRKILGVEREWLVALVGIGNLGHAIARYGGFTRRGFKIAALFDNDPRKIGQQVGELEVLGMDALSMVIKGLRIQMAIVAVPAAVAQEVVDQLIAAGVRGILNYAPTNLSVPKGVRVHYIDPVVMLQGMTYHLKKL
jgi:redox-sensing transcriptional repressor